MSAVAAAAPSRLDRRGLGVLSFGHLSVDLAQGTVPALIPFMVRDRGYSYAAAGALLLFSGIGSSFLQPLLGAFADRIRAGWMMPVGTFLAATGVALSGQFDSYLVTACVLVISSIGVAMYHPEAVRFASYVSVASGRQGTGMSMFAVGGLSGWALGPILITPVVALVGLRGTAIVAIVPLAATLALAVNLGYFEQFRPTVATGHAAREDLPAERLAGLHGGCVRRDAAHGGAVRLPGLRAALRLAHAAVERGRRQCGNRGDAGRRSARDTARRTSLRPARLPPRRGVVARCDRAARAVPAGRAAARCCSR